jgi:hypothetical protein
VHRQQTYRKYTFQTDKIPFIIICNDLSDCRINFNHSEYFIVMTFMDHSSEFNHISCERAPRAMSCNFSWMKSFELFFHKKVELNFLKKMNPTPLVHPWQAQNASNVNVTHASNYILKIVSTNIFICWFIHSRIKQ